MPMVCPICNHETKEPMREALKILLDSAGCLAGEEAEIPEEISAQFDINLDDSRMVHDALQNANVFKCENCLRSFQLEPIPMNESQQQIAREAAKQLNCGPSADSYPKNIQIILSAIERATEAKLPDIGKDPLKLCGEERASYGAKYKERLIQAHTVQQTGVPDQTALVWRIDLIRLCSDLTLAESRAAPASAEQQDAKRLTLLIELCRLNRNTRFYPCESITNEHYWALESGDEQFKGASAMDALDHAVIHFTTQPQKERTGDK